LAGTSLSFDHPVHGNKVVIKAGLDASFSAIVDGFGWQGFIEDVS